MERDGSFTRTFEIALVLLGILSASEMMNFSSFFGQKVALAFGTIPFIAMILIWIIKELYVTKISLNYALFLTELSWLIWSLTLAYHLLFVYVSLLSASILVAFSGSILTGFVVYGIIIGAYFLEYRNMTVYYRWSKWLITRLALSITGALMVYLIFVSLPK